MAAWHRDWRTDLGLRGVGLILCGLAYLAIARLVALPLAARGGEAVGFGLAAYGWATIGFLGASAGGILTLCGAHILDEIKVSARWRVRRIPHDQLGGPNVRDSIRQDGLGTAPARFDS